MTDFFYKNGVAVLGIPRAGLFSQGILEVCYTDDGYKFYKFTPNNQVKSWVHIDTVKIEVIHGGTVVEFQEGNNENDSPITLTCFSEMAIFKYMDGLYEDDYWLFHKTRLKPVCKEWLIYFDILPGQKPSGTVVEPPQMPEHMKEILLPVANIDEDED